MKPRKQPGPQYRVLVWDCDRQKFGEFFKYFNGPFNLFGIRTILRELLKRGYDLDTSIHIERIGWEKEYATKPVEQAPAERLLF